MLNNNFNHITHNRYVGYISLEKVKDSSCILHTVWMIMWLDIAETPNCIRNTAALLSSTFLEYTKGMVAYRVCNLVRRTRHFILLFVKYMYPILNLTRIFLHSLCDFHSPFHQFWILHYVQTVVAIAKTTYEWHICYANKYILCNMGS